MSLAGAYGPVEPGEARRAIHAALDVGIDLFDTAEGYGAGDNERFAGEVLRASGVPFRIATKFGLRFRGGRIEADGTPDNARRAVEGSLERLGLETIDLLYLHRRDRGVPIEETVGAMADLVTAGKVQWLGLSEVSAETLRRAHTVHPITAVQSEYSLWTRTPERGVLPACEALGVGFVAYSPLGRGFLTREPPAAANFDEHDVRRTTPYFEPGHLERNLALVDHLRRLADRAGVGSAPLALAWLLDRSDRIVPIFGTRRAQRVRDNARAADLELDATLREQLEAAFPPGVASGDPAPRVTAHLDEH